MSDGHRPPSPIGDAWAFVYDEIPFQSIVHELKKSGLRLKGLPTNNNPSHVFFPKYRTAFRIVDLRLIPPDRTVNQLRSDELAFVTDEIGLIQRCCRSYQISYVLIIPPTGYPSSPIVQHFMKEIAEYVLRSASSERAFRCHPTLCPDASHVASSILNTLSCVQYYTEHPIDQGELRCARKTALSDAEFNHLIQEMRGFRLGLVEPKVLQTLRLKREEGQ